MDMILVDTARVCSVQLPCSLSTLCHPQWSAVILYVFPNHWWSDYYLIIHTNSLNNGKWDRTLVFLDTNFGRSTIQTRCIWTLVYSTNACWQNDPFLASQTIRDVNQEGKANQNPPSSFTTIKLSWSLSLAEKKCVPLFFFPFYWCFKKEVNIYSEGMENCAPFCLIRESKPADISSWLNLVPVSPFLATPRSDLANFYSGAGAIKDWLASQFLPARRRWQVRSALFNFISVFDWFDISGVGIGACHGRAQGDEETEKSVRSWWSFILTSPLVCEIHLFWEVRKGSFPASRSNIRLRGISSLPSLWRHLKNFHRL